MRFHGTTFVDAMLIEVEKRRDERGYFARVFCAAEFGAQGLVTDFVQANYSHNAQRGTLRGLHFQRAPHGEVKLVWVVRGALHDVIIDLRPDSPSFGKWEGFDLTEDNGRMLYVPAGFAHGFQTLQDDTDAIYQVSHPYTPEAEDGVRWDDPEFGIKWPLPVSVISDKDAAWPQAGPNLKSAI
jgi:dTDP-4-dehydrorhamnose 3,5-epimerase